MATTPTYINQRINNLQSQINDIISGGGVPTSSDLAVVLVNGNSAGATKLNMNNNDIDNATRLGVNSITDISTTVLDGYNIETTEQNTTGVINTATLSPNNITCDNIDNNTQTDSYTQLTPNTITSFLSTDGGANYSYTNLKSSNFNYFQNGTQPTYFKYEYGGSEIFRYDTNGITTATNKTIVLTDGTTTNTIDKNGYTTRNTTANATYYLNFSDSSGTGTGAIQKTAGIECNPSTKTITATTFAGTTTNATNAVIGTDNASTLAYLTFVKTSGAGNKGLFIDDTTTPLTYNPSIGTLTTTTFSGALSGNASTATTATNVGTTVDTTTASNCPVGFFVNSSGTQPVKVNSNLSFQPTTNTLRATTFEGALTGTASSATNVILTSDNTSGTYYIPFAKTSGTGGKPLFIDDTTGPLTYNPSTATLTTSVFVGGTINGTSGVLLQYNGTTQSSITTNGVQETLLTTQGTATYSSPTLTLLTTATAPYPTTYGNIITFSGSAVAQTISAITVPTNMPINGMYYCYITNSNTSLGAITINATSLGTGIKTTYTSPVVIPISGFALGTLTKVGASAFVWSVNVVA